MSETRHRNEPALPELSAVPDVGAAMAWSAKFDHPIKWGARTLHTLHDARAYILNLPRPKQMLPAWQAATEALLQAAQHGGLWLELARIGMLQALLGPNPIAESDPAKKYESNFGDGSAVTVHSIDLARLRHHS
jgi:hypothetical protein